MAIAAGLGVAGLAPIGALARSAGEAGPAASRPATVAAATARSVVPAASAPRLRAGYRIEGGQASKRSARGRHRSAARARRSAHRLPGVDRIPLTAKSADRYAPLYRVAGEAFGVSWRLIASIHQQETSFSSAPGTYHGLNFANCCAGPMQFNVTNGPVSTWERVRDAYRRAERPDDYPHRTRRHPSVYDDFDAIMAAAALLRSNGASERLDGTAWLASYHYYGHDLYGLQYADTVLARATGWARGGLCVHCPVDASLTAKFDAAFAAPYRAEMLAAERRAKARAQARAKAEARAKAKARRERQAQRRADAKARRAAQAAAAQAAARERATKAAARKQAAKSAAKARRPAASGTAAPAKRSTPEPRPKPTPKPKTPKPRVPAATTTPAKTPAPAAPATTPTVTPAAAPAPATTAPAATTPAAAPPAAPAG